MKEFMFIFRGGSDATPLSPEEMQQHMQKWFAWIEDLQNQNIYVGGEPLTPGGKILKGKQPVITDGPFTESKEMVGGYLVIKAESLEAAAEIAKGYPEFHLDGVVEVREIMKY